MWSLAFTPTSVFVPYLRSDAVEYGSALTSSQIPVPYHICGANCDGFADTRTGAGVPDLWPFAGQGVKALASAGVRVPELVGETSRNDWTSASA